MRLLRRPEISAAQRKLGWPLAWLLACGLAGMAAQAQELTEGAIHGVVSDAFGQPAALEVTAKNLETGEVRTIAALHDGTFLLAGMPVGEYELRRSTEPAVAVTVAPGLTTEVLLGMPGSGPLYLIPAVAVAALPPPGLEPDENDDGLVSLRGLAATQGLALMDGVGATQSFASVPVGTGIEAAVDSDDDSDSAELTTGPSHGLSRGRHAGVSYTYAQGSVREFRLGSDNYSAQAGSAGGVLTQITRSGGERLHGSAVFNLRSSVLAARDPLAIDTSYSDGAVTTGEVKPHDLRENVALTIGGPLPRLNRVRFFYAFDEQRRGFPAISSPADANFYELTAIQMNLLANRGVSTGAINSALNLLSSVTGEVPRRADQTINFGRVDWRVRPRFGIGLEYNRVRWDSPAGLIDSPVVARGRASLGNAAGSVDQVLLRISPRLSGRTLSEARLAFTRDLQFETPQTPLPQEAPIAPGGLSPEVNIGPNGLLFGTPASLSQIAYPDEQRVEADETVTLVRGHHLIEAGGTFALAQEHVATLANAAGTFRYDSGATSGKDGGLVDFITDWTFNVNAYPNGGCPSIYAADHIPCFRSYSQSFGEQRVAFSTADWAGFIEDTWRLKNRLMLHAGVRYEYTHMPSPQQPNAALDALFGARGATSAFPEDRNNLGPRVSAEFEPLGAGRGVLRIGYGVFYGRMPGATIQASLSDTGLPSSTTRIRITPSAIIGCPQVPNQGFGYLCSFTAPPTGAAALTTSAVVFDRRFRLPTVQQASVSLEREIGRRSSLSVGFIMNADRQLPTSTDMNIAPSTQRELFQLQGGTGAVGVRDGETFVVPIYTQRISMNYGPVTDVISNANATYNGLVAKADTRRVRGLLVAALTPGRRRSTSGRASRRFRGPVDSSTRSPTAMTKGSPH
jgi:hypothetical protein